MWLGLVQQLAEVRVDEVPVLLSQVRVVKEPWRRCNLIVSCQRQHMLQQSVVAATISYGSCGHSRDG